MLKLRDMGARLVAAATTATAASVVAAATIAAATASAVHLPAAASATATHLLSTAAASTAAAELLLTTAAAGAAAKRWLAAASRITTECWLPAAARWNAKTALSTAAGRYAERSLFHARRNANARLTAALERRLTLPAGVPRVVAEAAAGRSRSLRNLDLPAALLNPRTIIPLELAVAAAPLRTGEITIRVRHVRLDPPAAALFHPSTTALNHLRRINARSPNASR
jgi:hypothetical protein